MKITPLKPQVKIENLFLIAAPRSGSTQLGAWLETHSDISSSSIKEPNYFSSHEFSAEYVIKHQLNDVDPSEYAVRQQSHPMQFSMFRNIEDYSYLIATMKTRWRLDASTTYLHCPEAAEFDYHLIKAGGRISLENETCVDYIPKGSLKSTFRQYAQNGNYRIRRAIRHNLNLGPRQLIPALLFPILIFGGLLAGLVSPVLWLIPVGYFVTMAAVALFIAKKDGRVHLAGLIAGLAYVSHLGFSAGVSSEFLRCRFSAIRRAALRNDQRGLISMPSNLIEDYV